MNRLLLFVFSIFLCMAGISANHPSSLLPLPQKYQFNGKKSSGELTVEEKYVSQIEGAKFQEEAYHLSITRKGILLEATTPKGMYWGRQTLEQLKYTKNKKTWVPQCVKAQVIYFSSRRRLEKGIYLEDGNIIYCRENPEKVCHVDELKLLGMHNYENVMAAVAMAAAYHVPMEIIRKTIREFTAVEHRIEFVAEKNGVAYYNDSKGTNPDAAIKGIQAMNRPTFLIGGGYDKDSSYDEWIQSFDGKVKKLVLLGATKEKINETAKRLGFTDTILADTFEEAVNICVEQAEPGDAVLLSPACASWGMFKNYEERGDKFKELVNQL